MEESVYAEGGFPHEEKVRMLATQSRQIRRKSMITIRTMYGLNYACNSYWWAVEGRFAVTMLVFTPTGDTRIHKLPIHSVAMIVHD